MGLFSGGYVVWYNEPKLKEYYSTICYVYLLEYVENMYVISDASYDKSILNNLSSFQAQLGEVRRHRMRPQTISPPSAVNTTLPYDSSYQKVHLLLTD